MKTLIEINEKNISGILKRMKKLLKKHTVYDSIVEMSSLQEEILKNGLVGKLGGVIKGGKKYKTLEEALSKKK